MSPDEELGTLHLLPPPGSEEEKGGAFQAAEAGGDEAGAGSQQAATRLAQASWLLRRLGWCPDDQHVRQQAGCEVLVHANFV